jgi:selenocysteine lyase/cysteine desulfurase
MVEATVIDQFRKYREQVIGISQVFDSPYGPKKLIYADWTASGRMYNGIEKRMLDDIFPLVGNTHTETNITGTSMTLAYHKAMKIIKQHVNASSDDILISTNSGMTGVINKFQRILGLKIHENYKDQIKISEEDRPIVFVSHMEHHSNQTTWLETICDVVVVDPNEEGLICLENFEKIIQKYSNRKVKIAAITSCSNVTGIHAPYHKIAEIIHNNGGLCFVDFACSAPYVEINMHPENDAQYLDAIYFSPHKFLGGPGTAGALIFNKKLYKNDVPDNPGGGTVDWTNPWGQHKYVDDIEAREDGGTPSFLQTIKSALCVKLKEEMGVKAMHHKEDTLLNIMWDGLIEIPNLHILADNVKSRHGILSFYIDDLHFNLCVKLLNDKFGIQVRGGCSCAGTYGHYLLHVNKQFSDRITSEINQGNLTDKPGWVRLSIHPIMTEEEMHFMVASVKDVAENYKSYALDYAYNSKTNEFNFVGESKEENISQKVENWFDEKLS